MFDATQARSKTEQARDQAKDVLPFIEETCRKGHRTIELVVGISKLKHTLSDGAVEVLRSLGYQVKIRSFCGWPWSYRISW